MPVSHTLFEEMAASASTMEDLVRLLSQCLALPCVIRLTFGDS
jgi:hypothetical protein